VTLAQDEEAPEQAQLHGIGGRHGPIMAGCGA
jgi:hypothetical protein